MCMDFVASIHVRKLVISRSSHTSCSQLEVGRGGGDSLNFCMYSVRGLHVHVHVA